MRRRATLLVMTMGMALLAVACGRATQEQINQALGITPTATRSPEEIATSTALAIAQATERAAAASPGAEGGSLAALGNVAQGRNTFQFNCAQCHRAGSPSGAPLLTGPDSPAAKLSDQQLYTLIRDGTNHTPPGPIPPHTLSDQRIADIIAYLRSIAQ